MLEKIDSYKQWQGLASGKKLANALLMPNDVTLWINEGSAYYLSKESSSALLVDQGGFFRVYIVATEDSPLEVLDSLKEPALMEFVFNEKPSAVQTDLMKKIEDAGFKHYSTERRYVLSIVNASNPSVDSSVVAVKASDVEPILSLWQETLKPFQTVLPSRASLEKSAENGRILAIGDDPQAAMLVSIKGTTATFGSVAVSLNHRGKHLSTRLYNTAIATLPQEVTRVVAWVEEGNTPSEHLHKRVGFIPDGSITQGFLRTNA